MNYKRIIFLTKIDSFIVKYHSNKIILKLVNKSENVL